MTDRLKLDEMTSDDLDALYEQLERAQRIAVRVLDDEPPATRWLHISLRNPDEFTVNRQALCLRDFINAEFPGLRVDTDAREWDEPGRPATAQAADPAWTPPPPGSTRS